MDIEKIHESVVWSNQKLAKFRKNRKSAIQEFVGYNYSDNGSAKRMPVDFLELATTIYLRLLAARSPKCLVTTEAFELKPMAADLEIVLNKIPDEIKLVRTIRRAVLEAMFSMAVVKIGVSATREDTGDEPFVSLVQADDYFVDMSARSWDEVQFEGNDYWMDVEDVKEYFGRDLAEEQYSGVSKDGQEQASTVTVNETGKPLYGRVLLRDVYVYRGNRLITYAVETMEVLRDVPWDGPDGSPYVKLWFNEVPGNLLPLPPVSLWRDLSNLGNSIFRKLAKQADSKKTVAAFGGGTDEDVQNLRSATDGSAIRYNGSAPDMITVGGVDTGNLAFLIQLKDLFNIFAGNIDALGGLSPQADTAAQEKLISDASSARIRAMSDATIEFAQEIFRRLAWYVWTDPVRKTKFRKTLSKEFGIGVTKEWTPETRDGDFIDYNFTIDVYSMQDDSPAARVQKLITAFERIVFPLLPQLQEQGAYIDTREVLDYVGKNSNMQDLAGFVKFMDGRMPPSAPVMGGSPEPDYVSTKPPVTRRTYERVNRPGATRHGRDAAMMQTLLGGRAQKAEMAGLSMGRSMT